MGRRMSYDLDHVLKILKENKGVTLKQLSEILDVSTTTAQKAVAKLKQTQSIVSKKGMKGYWYKQWIT